MSLWEAALEFLGLRDQETRAAHTLKEVDFWLNDAGWGSSTAAGVSVNDQVAMTVPDVFACVQVISEDVGRCPLKLQQQVNADWVDADRHPLWELLHELPNPETTAQSFWAQLVRDLVIGEHAYAEIVRDGVGRVSQLWRLDPERMTVDRDPQTLLKRYTYRLGQGDTRVWSFDPDRPPVLDLAYISPIRRCRDLIGLAVALDTYVGKFFAQNARPSGILRTPKGLSIESRERLSASWKAAYGGAANAHKVAVLEDDLQWQSISADNDKAQLLDLRKFIRSQIAGAFKVPPHKIGDLDRATFSNIEQQDREYVSTALAPLFSNLAQAARRDLLTTRQYPRYRAMWDYEALIQTDIQSRMAAFSQARQNGIMSANDCRRKLGENPIPSAEGGNLYHMNGTMIPLTGAPEPPPAPSPDPVDVAAAEEAQRAHELACSQARQPIVNVEVKPPDVRVEAPKVDVHIDPGAVQVDARTTIADGAVQTRIEPTTVNVQPPVFKDGAFRLNTTVNLPKPGPVQKRFDYDARGEIATVTEVPVE